MTKDMQEKIDEAKKIVYHRHLKNRDQVQAAIEFAKYEMIWNDDPEVRDAAHSIIIAYGGV